MCTTLADELAPPNVAGARPNSPEILWDYRNLGRENLWFRWGTMAGLRWFYPLWKNCFRQLGWWISQVNEKIKSMSGTTNQNRGDIRLSDKPWCSQYVGFFGTPPIISSMDCISSFMENHPLKNMAWNSPFEFRKNHGTKWDNGQFSMCSLARVASGKRLHNYGKIHNV